MICCVVLTVTYRSGCLGRLRGNVGGIGGNDVWSLRHGGRVALGNGKIPKITDESG